jgi:hypothetical protein
MLEELPARMDRLELQIVQLRAENSADHSAIRQEIQALGTELRGEMKTLGGEVGELRTTMEMLHHRRGIEMRLLFEDALSRIAAMNDARPGARGGNP